LEAEGEDAGADAAVEIGEVAWEAIAAGCANVSGPFWPQAPSNVVTAKEPAAVIMTRPGDKLRRRFNIA
jgi:hypothetical protein